MVFGLQEELATSATLAVELVGRSVANPSRQQVSTCILKNPLFSVFFCSKYTKVLTCDIFFYNPSRQQTFGSVREFRISELLDQVVSPPLELLFMWCPLQEEHEQEQEREEKEEEDEEEAVVPVVPIDTSPFSLSLSPSLSLSRSLSPRAFPPLSSSLSAVSRRPF